MTTSTSFAEVANPAPATPEHLAEVLADPRFGKYFTDHMVTIEFTPERGWHNATVGPHQPLTLSPCAAVLHYGQAVFEGLKAYRRLDGSVASFRPEENATRFRASARRLAMPELPDELFLASLSALVARDERWVPHAEEHSLYLRPLMISTSADLLVTPARDYLFVLVASPAGAYYPGGVTPVTVWLSHEYSRAAPGGTGSAKCAGNYAGAFVAQRQAVEAGCDQVVWLDAVDRGRVEEMGVNNLFFVFGSGPDARVVTPGLTGSLLPGITRDSVLRLAGDLGYRVEERAVSTAEWERAARSGDLTEVFACGTAAVITPVGTVKHAGGQFVVGGHQPGPVTLRLRRRLTAIHRGSAPDPYDWMCRLC
ncbi:Branched-chain amino acid aminotransferase [Alloactinosynnema sp. L-07]|uniref:branched-chain amino acid aminotransferase n=1 Tax=Alloactinosynnema sp. L-07 TaxID=1653480 RepID=UPI00065F00B0|nr:branched-chain amino acid aminotransferase [Alloactinosynnema sp. L-07]CRK56749.1 Branched-chain amino acid aminotransferase [Alloactinosynnema sp. L-07]